MNYEKRYENLETWQIFPMFYYNLGKSKNDMQFLASNMAKLARRIRIELCEKYSSTYVSNGREKANSELLTSISIFELSHPEFFNSKDTQNPTIPNNLKNRIERIKQLQKSKPKYGEIFK
jgi:hypothetical protein